MHNLRNQPSVTKRRDHRHKLSLCANWFNTDQLHPHYCCYAFSWIANRNEYGKVALDQYYTNFFIQKVKKKYKIIDASSVIHVIGSVYGFCFWKTIYFIAQITIFEFFILLSKLSFKIQLHAKHTWPSGYSIH